jgi:hypothetical protein
MEEIGKVVHSKAAETVENVRMAGKQMKDAGMALEGAGKALRDTTAQEPKAFGHIHPDLEGKKDTF